jgi:hypothetical protein
LFLTLNYYFYDNSVTFYDDLRCLQFFFNMLLLFMYDIIGDIHGHYSDLTNLLDKLGYKKTKDCFSHPEGRKLIFVGDYIDRGKQIRETLFLVRSLVENGQAIALMGNHEYNAILFNALNRSEGGYLRKHKIKNIVQHYEMILQFKGFDQEYKDYIKWFMSLPLFYENDEFRVVHACWDNSCIDYLKKELGGNLLNEEFVYRAAVKNSREYSNIEDTLKGKELLLPAGASFFDSDGFERKNVRVKWWKNSKNISWDKYSVLPLKGLPESEVSGNHFYYSQEEKPVFFGHYWLRGIPQLMSSNSCCLDYSVAKGCKLVAYRHNTNELMNAENFVWVEVPDQNH